MEFESYIRFALALVFVLGLIGALGVVAKRFGLSPRVSGPSTGGAKRVQIVNVTNVDGKRRLILVRRDDTEHLILLGANGETVVEAGITPPQNQAQNPAPGRTDNAEQARVAHEHA